MIDLQTFTKIDSIICKFANEDLATDSKNLFINKPTFNNPNIEPVMNYNKTITKSDNVETSTARFYEVCDGIIHESFQLIDNEINSSDLLDNSTDNEYKEDLIIVISDNHTKDELINIYNNIKKRLKFIVHYGNNTDVKQVFQNFSKLISVDSLSKAVKKSHLLAQNGHTIFFPKVSNRFDYFGNLSFN